MASAITVAAEPAPLMVSASSSTVTASLPGASVTPSVYSTSVSPGSNSIAGRVGPGWDQSEQAARLAEEFDLAVVAS